MFVVRQMEKRDAAACADLLNHTIQLGGTTAYEEPYSVDDFDQHYREETAICHIVEQDGKILGFQGLFDIGDGVLSVGSFTDQRTPVRGAGRALIEQSKKVAKDLGYVSIIAKVTSDNSSGLSYYGKVGFVDDHVLKNDHQRSNGTWVDRVVKRLVL